MTRLADQIEVARAHLAHLERQANTATCAEIGHDWISKGGANCGCHKDACCSIPVHECSRCGGCDYGENKWAADHIAQCEHKNPPEICPCCYRTDEDYSERVSKGLERGDFACLDAWHSHDHLRTQPASLPAQENDRG
ncbi:MAG: hypothetical protein NT113_22890 [Hyphomicrobiales bacterium]|nr:hypothetical protein [Hyphomicrobiales bacterium]